MNEIIFVDPYQSEETLNIYRTILPEGFSGDSKTFSMIGACDEDGIMLGVLGFDDLGEQCNILWLYVEPFARRMGVASALLEELISCYWDNNDIKPIVMRYDRQIVDDSIHSFFEASPYFDVQEEHQIYSAYAEDIFEKDKYAEKYKNPIQVVQFFELSQTRQQVFLQKMREEGYFDVRDFKEWSKACIPELSLCTVEEFTVKSAIFVNRAGAGEYEISFVYSENPLHLYSVVKEAIRVIFDIDPGAKISASIMNDIAGQLFHKIFTRADKSRPVLTAEWNYELPDYISIENQDEDMDDYEVVEFW